MVFSSCNRDQHTYYTSVSYSQAENTESVISIKAVLGTINLFWNGDYTFTGNDEGYTDLKAQTKFVESKLAILAHGNEIKTHMAADDYFYYRMYRKDGNVLLESTKFYLDANGNLTSTDEVDNVED